MSCEKGGTRRAAMEIKVGDIFESFLGVKDLSVKKIVNNWVVLESPDRKKQVLTGVDNLKVNLFYLKKENKGL
jgi:hypothetical protein